MDAPETTAPPDATTQIPDLRKQPFGATAAVPTILKRVLGNGETAVPVAAFQSSI